MNCDSQYSTRKCDNCGEYIEDSEIEKNPKTIYCCHCRITLFDGPDLYD